MTTNHSTLEQGKTLPPTQTIEAAKCASALLQQSHPPVVAEQDRETVYLETGAGLVFAIANDGHFSLSGLHRGGRELISFTPAETRALYNFWWSICAPGVLEHLPAAIAHVKASRTKEDDHGNA